MKIRKRVLHSLDFIVCAEFGIYVLNLSRTNISGEISRVLLDCCFCIAWLIKIYHKILLLIWAQTEPFRCVRLFFLLDYNTFTHAVCAEQQDEWEKFMSYKISESILIPFWIVLINIANINTFSFINTAKFTLWKICFALQSTHTHIPYIRIKFDAQIGDVLTAHESKTTN